MNAYVYILGMWLITAIIRVLPLLVLRDESQVSQDSSPRCILLPASSGGIT